MPMDGGDGEVLAVVHPQRRIEGGDDPPRAGLGLADRAQVFQHHRELVAADPRDGVPAADHLLQALGHGAQGAVAGGVAEAVVDVLEVVQVEEQHRHARTLAARAHDRPRQALGQQRAVGQVGEGVVVGEVAQLLFDAPALGDVGPDHDVEALAGARFADGVGAHLAQEFAAVLAALPHLAGPRRVVDDPLADALIEGAVVLVAVQQGDVLAQYVVGVVAADAGERGVDRGETEIGADHHHRLRHVAHHLAGDAALALLLADRGDVAGGAGDAGDGRRRPRPPRGRGRAAIAICRPRGRDARPGSRAPARAGRRAGAPAASAGRRDGCSRRGPGRRSRRGRRPRPDPRACAPARGWPCRTANTVRRRPTAPAACAPRARAAPSGARAARAGAAG